MMGLGMTKRSALKTLSKIRDPDTGKVIDRCIIEPRLRKWVMGLSQRVFRGLRQIWQVPEGKIPPPGGNGIYLKAGACVGGLSGPFTTMIEVGARDLPEELGHHIVESRTLKYPNLWKVLEQRYREILKKTNKNDHIFEEHRLKNAEEFWGHEMGEVLRGRGGGMFSGDEILKYMGFQ